ncbi:MAG: hypothetical protein RBT65_16580, partial [Methanolobus sp.]|nr:hypothetical protein [Methanolobus sp.]
GKSTCLCSRVFLGGDSLNQKKQSLAPLKYEGHSRAFASLYVLEEFSIKAVMIIVTIPIMKP